MRIGPIDGSGGCDALVGRVELLLLLLLACGLALGGAIKEAFEFLAVAGLGCAVELQTQARC